MPTHEFELTISRLLSSGEVERPFALSEGDVTPGVSNGVPMVSVDWEGPTLAEAMIEAIEVVESCGPGLRVVSLEADLLVSLGEIADRVGLTREAVRLRLKGEHSRGPFPLPDLVAGGRRLWRWSTVAEWYGLDSGWAREARTTTRTTTRAINGWLALRDTVPTLVPELRTLGQAIEAAWRKTKSEVPCLGGKTGSERHPPGAWRCRD